MNSSQRKITALILSSVVLAAIALGAWLFFGGDAPSEVDLEATAAAVQGASTTTVDPATPLGSVPPTTQSAGTTAPVDSGGATGEVSGQWTVDTSLGEFTVTGDTTASFVGFRVNEELTTVGSTTAVGRTPLVSGSIELDGTVLAAAEIVADLTGIKSDQARRENAIQRALNTSTNPQATFVLSEPIELGEGAADGDVVEAEAVGDLTINGITQSIRLAVRAQLLDGKILVTASMDLEFSDFEVSAPSAPIVLSVEDSGVLELQLWFSR